PIRSTIARERGPGTSVLSSIVRVAAMDPAYRTGLSQGPRRRLRERADGVFQTGRAGPWTTNPEPLDSCATRRRHHPGGGGGPPPSMPIVRGREFRVCAGFVISRPQPRELPVHAVASTRASPPFMPRPDRPGHAILRKTEAALSGRPQSGD